jgi:hypothetical protein
MRTGALAGVAAIAAAAAGTSALADQPVCGSEVSGPSGQLVLSITADSSDVAMQLTPAAGGDKIVLRANPGGLFGGRGDFSIPGGDIQSKGAFAGTSLAYYQHIPYRGRVLVIQLAPGDYRLEGISVGNTGGVASYGGTTVVQRYFSGAAISSLVNIKVGVATYIGEYKTLEVKGDFKIGFRGFKGWRVIVSDQSTRDLPIARQKCPVIKDTEVAVPDVDSLHNINIGSEP